MTLLPCHKCGAAAGNETVIERSGVEVGRGWLCDPCLDRAHAIADENASIFESLLAAGVPRDKANEMMIARLDGRGAAT